jgi:hypothetical protein
MLEAWITVSAMIVLIGASQPTPGAIEFRSLVL